MFINEYTHLIVPAYERGSEELTLANKIEYSDIVENIISLLKEFKDVSINYDISKEDIEKVYLIYDTKINEVMKTLSDDKKERLSGDYSISFKEIMLKISNLVINKKDITTYKQELNIENDNELGSCTPFDINIDKEIFFCILFNDKFISKLDSKLSRFVKDLDNIFIALLQDKDELSDPKRSYINDYLNAIIQSKLGDLICIRTIYFDIFDRLLRVSNGEIIENDIDTTEGKESLLDIFQSIESFYSMEGGENDTFSNIGGISDKLHASKYGKLKEKLDNVTKDLNKTRNKFSLFLRKAKNYLYYRKYLGRIDHMYERYADSSPILENKMHGDPVEILKGKAITYIENYTKENIALFQELQSLIDKVQDTENDPTKALSVMKPFLGQYSINIKQIKKLPNAMLKATKHRIAESLLKDNKIYGYTVESIVVKNFPPANHAIVALFVENSHEKPQEQYVSDIFQDVEDFKLIASNEKKPFFNFTNVTQTLLAKSIRSEHMMKVSKFASSPKKASQSNEKVPKEMKIIWKSIEGAMNTVAFMKAYASKLIDGYFSMMMRIDNLAKIAIKSMLNTEREKTDERHEKGFKSTSFKKHKGYSQNEDNTLTAGEKEKEAEQERVDEKRESHKQNISDIKSAMKKFRM
jgi:hypothetical protein